MKCTLSIEINECPFCNKEDMICNKEDKCTFQKDDNIQPKQKYVRQERWYEKYYRKR